MFGFFFAEGPITCFEEAAAQVDLKKFGRWHRGMVSAPSFNLFCFVQLVVQVLRLALSTSLVMHWIEFYHCPECGDSA